MQRLFLYLSGERAAVLRWEDPQYEREHNHPVVVQQVAAAFQTQYLHNNPLTGFYTFECEVVPTTGGYIDLKPGKGLQPMSIRELTMMTSDQQFNQTEAADLLRTAIHAFTAGNKELSS